ncbi:hypothetical protein D8B26_000599 [Coccidioides posadasii str. Silveira]|uniref:uncharacterized protein n=1 Tax=Coccidioides posadasii (strain RMSCC 757 / Silveira) TaxID=443226 RepID=UPI001BEE1723|nr:hypothetical protein D8B26_000599 [Coccidioides posadasii str. Silveira]
MLDPVELNAYPSCYGCASWSTDGELAIAAGENVHLLTPKFSTQRQEEQTTLPRLNSQWEITKIRVNIFTQDEWPLLMPQAGRVFSVGEEQSLSHVTAVSWSAPGLATYKRCMLGVLTSNLLLSLWEATDGAGKWARIGVVNSSLEEYFRASVDNDDDLLKRKQRIRSFTWTAPCNEYDKGPVDDSEAANGPRKWGVHLLVVANDAGDIVLLRLRPHETNSNSWIVVASHFLLNPTRNMFPSIDSSSLFARSLQGKNLIRHMACKSWNIAPPPEEDGTLCLESMLGLIYGSELRLLRLQANCKYVEYTGWDLWDIRMLELDIDADTDIVKGTEFTGPITWIYKDGRVAQGLLVGRLGSVSTLAFQDPVESQRPGQGFLKCSVSQRYLGVATPDSALEDWSSITGIISIYDATSNSVLSSAASLSASVDCYQLQSRDQEDAQGIDGTAQACKAEWQRQIESFRSRFDLDNDLGGMSAVRIWGLTTYHGWTAVCFTIHPTDMVEHLTPSHERLSIVFSPFSEHNRDHTSPGMPWNFPVLDQSHAENARRKVLNYILDESHRSLPDDRWIKKMQYAASCCVIIQSSYDGELLNRAKSAIAWLQESTSLDFTTEKSLLDEIGSNYDDGTLFRSVPAKAAEEAGGPASEVFETCEICGSGIEWYSATESQCHEGHIFVRCGVTLLSIQDPFISNRCSRCETEYLDHARLVEKGQLSKDDGHTGLLTRLLSTFDTCVYCTGKLRS